MNIHAMGVMDHILDIAEEPFLHHHTIHYQNSMVFVEIRTLTMNAFMRRHFYQTEIEKEQLPPSI